MRTSEDLGSRLIHQQQPPPLTRVPLPIQVSGDYTHRYALSVDGACGT